MKKLKYITGAIIILAGSVSTSYAKTTMSTVHKKYPIRGNNIKKIHQVMRASGLKDVHGNVFAAKTTPRFTWKYNFALEGNKCAIKSVDVEVEITYELPELASYEGLSSADKAEWNRFYNATYKHEQGHADFSLKAAEEIEWEAVNIVPKESCGAMGRTANMLARNILSSHENDNHAYDRQTTHWVAQGAVLIAAR